MPSKAIQRLASTLGSRGLCLFTLLITLLALPATSFAVGGENVELKFSQTDQIYLYVSLVFGVIAVLVALFIRAKVLAQSPGDAKMVEVSAAVEAGARAYLSKQVRTMGLFVILLSIALFLNFNGQFGPMIATFIAVSFVAGVAASYIAGYVGMTMAVKANCRTAHAALTSYGRSLETAFRAGSVAGLITVGMGLLGATIIILLSGENAMKVLVGFGFGGSLAALFMRVGGGIFTKAADVGADLVGKVEAGIPEDDPRNPATIADNVGDNVGDCAGMAADVFESYEVTLVAAIVLGAATAAIFDQATWMRLILFALMARGVGILASIIGIFMVKGSDDVNTDPLKPITRGFISSAAVAAILTLALAYFMMSPVAGKPAILLNELSSQQQAVFDQLQAIKNAQNRIAAKEKVDAFAVTADKVLEDPAVKALDIPEDRERMMVAQALQTDIESLPEPDDLSGFSKVDLTDTKSKVYNFAAPAAFDEANMAPPTDNYVPLGERYKDGLIIANVKVTQFNQLPAGKPGAITDVTIDDVKLGERNGQKTVEVTWTNKGKNGVSRVDGQYVLFDATGKELDRINETLYQSPFEAVSAGAKVEDTGVDAYTVTKTYPSAVTRASFVPTKVEVQTEPAPAPTTRENQVVGPLEKGWLQDRIDESNKPGSGMRIEMVEETPVHLYANAEGDLVAGVVAGDKIKSITDVQSVGAPIQYFTQSVDELKKLQEARQTNPEAGMPQPKDATLALVTQKPVDWWRFFLCVFFGILMAFAFERLTDYYVSTHKRPVREVTDVSTAGPAPMIISGFALGMESSVFSVLAMVVCLIAPLAIFPPGEYGGYLLSFYGIALVGLGLLTTTGYILAMDTFGPISDNAQGVYEMSGAGHDNANAALAVQRLDAAGNTTKALTKGFAIATAVVAAVALFHSYVDAAKLVDIGLKIEVPEIFLGLLIGGAAPYLFSAFSINAVGRASFDLINEVRRQFRENPGIMAGTSKPDYGRCVEIVTAAAQKELLGPGVLAIFLPLAVAFGFSIGKEPTIINGVPYNLVGAQALGGFLAGTILSGQLMAVMLANAGGIWDNAKKLIEDGLYGGKGSEAHKAGVVCDTVGDPFKDTAGPALNPLIKVMNLVALLLTGTIIANHSQATLMTITGFCVVALAVSFWWSKRGSMASQMNAIAGSGPSVTGGNVAAIEAPTKIKDKEEL